MSLRAAQTHDQTEPEERLPMGTQADRRPCVVLAHRYAGMQEGIARGLAAARPGLEVVRTHPDALDATLEHLAPDCDPVVVCTEPTTFMQERAHGWIVDVVDGPAGSLLVGAGDTYRIVAYPSLEEIVAAILERLDAPAAPPWRRKHAPVPAEPVTDGPA